MSQENQESNENLEPCRNCKSDVASKIRRCPYCGILNPTVKVKDIIITMLLVTVVMFTYTYFLKI